MRTSAKNDMSYQALNLANQIRLLGGCPEYPVKTERSLRMSEFIFFIIGIMLGGLTGVAIMCCLQINHLSEREEVKNAKTKCADTFPSD